MKQEEECECIVLQSIHLQPQHLFAINKGYSIMSASFNHRQAKGQSETLFQVSFDCPCIKVWSIQTVCRIGNQRE